MREAHFAHPIIEKFKNVIYGIKVRNEIEVNAFMYCQREK